VARGAILILSALVLVGASFALNAGGSRHPGCRQFTSVQLTSAPDDPFFGVLKWQDLEIENDRTVTLRYSADFQGGEPWLPQVFSETTSKTVALGLKLEPPSGTGSGFFAFGEVPADRCVQVALPEPIANRKIIDAWQPEPPPEHPTESITVGYQTGPVAGGRQLYIDSIDLYKRGGQVNYRLQPGSDDEDESVYLEWDLAIEVDVGTSYEVPSGAYGGDAHEIDGVRDFDPQPPTTARLLWLIVYDTPNIDDRREVGRVQVNLVAPQS
jgi:hypothetical protein